MITEIHTEEAFQKEIATREGLSLIDFWATWCGPCRMQAPILEKLDAELGGSVKIFKVDVDENPALAQKLGIASIPTLLATENGKVKDMRVGLQTVDQLKQMLA